MHFTAYDGKPNATVLAKALDLGCLSLSLRSLSISVDERRLAVSLFFARVTLRKDRQMTCAGFFD